MERHQRLVQRPQRLTLSALALAIAWLTLPALAYDGPAVPDEALIAVPQDVRDGWAEREAEIALMAREIEAARVAIEETEEPVLDRSEVRTAHEEAAEIRADARAQVEVASHDLDAARLARRAAKEEKRLAKRELKHARSTGSRTDVIAARADRADAKGDLAAARHDLRVAKRTYARAGHDADRRRGEAAEAVAAAKRSRDEARDAFELAAMGKDLAEAELAVMEASHDVALAELEFERAEAAGRSGYAIDTTPYGAALDEARAAEAEARQALRRAGGEEPTRG